MDKSFVYLVNGIVKKLGPASKRDMCFFTERTHFQKKSAQIDPFATG